MHQLSFFVFRLSCQNVRAAKITHEIEDIFSCRIMYNGISLSSGTVNGFAAIETVINHIAHELKMDPWDVRKVNFVLGSGQTPA